MNQTRIYFPSLNGVRAIAASMVIIHHIEMIKSEMGLSVYNLPGDLGGLGVTLFFVLSKWHHVSNNRLQTCLRLYALV